MAVNGIIELVEALASGAPDRLVGTAEGQEVDFKASPYKLDEFKGKWELAKDVAAFANASGGCIVIGAKTEQHAEEVVETVTSVTPLPKNLVNASRYRDVISELCYPAVSGIEFAWYPPTGDRGVLLIRVPASSEKPVVVRKMVTLDGHETHGVLIPVRNQDRVRWESAERVHHAFASTQLLQARLVAAPERPARDLNAEADERLGHLLRQAGWVGEPSIAIQTHCPEGTDLLRHLLGDGGIAGALQRWEGTRRSGFDLASHREPTFIDGALYIDNPRWKLRVAPSGWVEFVVPAAWDFLGWGMDQGLVGEHAVRINSVAIVEVVLDYFRVLSSIVAQLAAKGEWTSWIRGQRLMSAGVRLRSGYGPRAFWPGGSTATADQWTASFHPTGTPGHDAYEALWRLYALWGLDAQQVPFVENGEVSLNAILALRG
jgi:hypothetical protein